ncbi:acetate/propionate family kinase [Rubinisphaera margarita]|uniref:acetate/propionate family kinase n=1 Tax=Rubinisphaera margarita TaxID=2909586 RepID=UPI001EE8CECA|nr:acetate/propionate family kinase [Rubinisphaera margarita]MCG6155680.1 acetate/propionate family kinase [Rubinisphaera margarita]
MNVLSLNPGSNTLKYKLVRVENEQILSAGYVEGVRGDETVAAVRDLFEQGFDHPIDFVAARVVHGGSDHLHPEPVSPELLQDLRSRSHLAPQHLPTDIAVIEAVQKARPKLPVIAVFDTAFHSSIPAEAARYAIGLEPGDRFHRFGFHGFAHGNSLRQYCRLTERSEQGLRLVSVHLGGGASLCAIRDGQSIDTTMGYTPTEGLVMSTRSGDVDPGILIELVRSGMTADDLEELLNRKSGLLGLSGLSADIRDLEPAAAEGNRNAELALEVYGHRFRRYLGAMIAVLNGCDAIVFSGGLAENSPTFRERMLKNLDGLGITVDAGRNGSADPEHPARISPEGKTIDIWMIPVDEELEMARKAVEII